MATDTLDLWQTAATGSWVSEAPDSLGTASSERSILQQSMEPDGNPRYLDRGPLSRGGMGEVRLVWDRRLGRTLARKILSVNISESAWRRFTAEARLTARLDHPGIVPVYDFGVLEDGRPWFTMKRVEGQTLSAVAGTWRLRRLLNALLRASEAVAYAHKEGVLHRDLKPDNIMVGAFGQVYVVDWGIARLPGTVDAPQDGFSPAQTRAGAVFGTPAYMPPEQAVGEQERISPASDVYGLGATMWHLLAGRPPYTGHGDDIIATLASRPAPPRLDEAVDRPLPAPLVSLCCAAMAPDPRDRPDSAAAFVSALSDWLDGVDVAKL